MLDVIQNYYCIQAFFFQAENPQITPDLIEFMYRKKFLSKDFLNIKPGPPGKLNTDPKKAEATIAQPGDQENSHEIAPNSDNNGNTTRIPTLTDL